MSTNKVVIYTDGGSRGNPGQAAIGVVFCDEKGNTLKKYGERLGICTNNEAEYQALIFALKKLKAVFGKEKIKSMAIEVRADSELLIKQMQGQYKIQNENIGKLFLTVWNLRVELPKIDFKAIPREQNSLADKLVNETLDNSQKTSSLF